VVKVHGRDAAAAAGANDDDDYVYGCVVYRVFISIIEINRQCGAHQLVMFCVGL